MVLLAGLVVLAGWRYGFTPLPTPLGSPLPEQALERAEAAFGPDNYWYWVQGLEPVVRFPGRGLYDFIASMGIWAQLGDVALTNRAALAQWVGQRPELAQCWEAVQACRSFRDPGLGAEPERRLLLPQTLLTVYPIWLAEEETRRGESSAAFGSLLQAWRVAARAAESSSMLQGPPWRLEACWRRLALTGPPLPEAQARRLLTALATTTNALPTPVRLYATLIERRRQAAPRYWEGPVVDWSDVGRAFRQAVREMTTDARMVYRRLRAWSFGLPYPQIGRPGGWNHLRFPLSYLLRTCQCAVLRPQDFRQAQLAYLTQVAALLSRGDVRGAETYTQHLLDHHQGHPLLRALDRPGVWDSLGLYPRPAEVALILNTWGRGLEAARLASALRLYRDLHAHWPREVRDLVPDLLPAVPVDPLAGTPFRYRRSGPGWEVWAGQGTLPHAGVITLPADQEPLFDSDEADESPLPDRWLGPLEGGLRLLEASGLVSGDSLAAALLRLAAPVPTNAVPPR